ncbi:cache domain-containing protein [Noviherbaspirillum denitrificans]|uniref:Histidine kinase n=1 Tax=Noviherbaspirillum denitrificans TaxID=1968433 RepID=A0A254T890_9BURK|nr:cache domain-containing protein [Noviherbaspirillum denitrificans]OWW18856.1 histidine kinase [Noviherbaspirillum denitrificans]
MKKFLSTLLLGLSALLFSHGALAAERGSAEEATALTKKAIAYLKANGKEKAFAEFNNPNGQFKDRDLYIFVFDLNGKTLAHGTNPKLLDKNLLDLKDADGKLFVKEFVDVAKGKGKGWIDYKWPHPATKAIEAKSTYVEKVDDMLVGCGIYK